MLQVLLLSFSSSIRILSARQRFSVLSAHLLYIDAEKAAGLLTTSWQREIQLLGTNMLVSETPPLFGLLYKEK